MKKLWEVWDEAVDSPPGELGAIWEDARDSDWVSSTSMASERMWWLEEFIEFGLGKALLDISSFVLFPVKNWFVVVLGTVLFLVSLRLLRLVVGCWLDEIKHPLSESRDFMYMFAVKLVLLSRARASLAPMLLLFVLWFGQLNRSEETFRALTSSNSSEMSWIAEKGGAFVSSWEGTLEWGCPSRATAVKDNYYYFHFIIIINYW